MAHIDAPVRGRRHDAAINLVPYIDLLMVLMAFLVACAAWTAMTALPALATGGGEACLGDACEAGPELRVHVSATSFSVGVPPAPENVVDRGALERTLREQRALLGDRADIATVIRVDDDAAFQHVAVAVDAVRAVGLAPPQVLVAQ